MMLHGEYRLYNYRSCTLCLLSDVATTLLSSFIVFFLNAKFASLDNMRAPVFTSYS